MRLAVYMMYVCMYIYEDVLGNLSCTVGDTGGRYLIFMAMFSQCLYDFTDDLLFSGMISTDALFNPINTLGLITKQCSFHCASFEK